MSWIWHQSQVFLPAGRRKLPKQRNHHLPQEGFAYALVSNVLSQLLKGLSMSRRLCIVIQSSKTELSSPPFNTYLIARKVSSAIRIKKLGLFVSTRLFSVGFPLVFITWHQLQAMSRGRDNGAGTQEQPSEPQPKAFSTAYAFRSICSLIFTRLPRLDVQLMIFSLDLGSTRLSYDCCAFSLVAECVNLLVNQVPPLLGQASVELDA